MEKDLFASHQIWGALKDVESALTQIDELGDAVISSELDEVRQVRAYAVALSEADQLFLIGAPLLDELNAAWSQVGTSLNNYLQNPAGHKSHLDNATGPYLDAVRSSLSRFPRADEAGAKKAAATRAASAYLSQLDESRELLSAQIQALKSDRDQMIERHKVELEEQTIVVENLRSQISALTSRIGEDETRISTALTESNEAFIKAQSERQERFGKWLEQQEERFDEEARPQYEGIMAAANRADEALKEVEELRTSVVNMSNLASGDILGDEYKKSARWDRVAGYIGYGVGILAGAMGIWILLFAFGDAQAGLEWPQVALKLGLTTGIGGVAAVAFRFGGQSLSRATAFKRQELELRALTPFLQGVQGSDEAKLTFVRQAFGRAWVPEQKADQSSDSAPNAELVKLVQAAVEAIARTSK
ncbi:hypothetical protein [Leucobacter sp. W1038]|uniref:hypothetical protein n=1 Tax=Leucobacter sp. W1038 TaxID=3438281 RepID=UPI003D97C2D4